MLNATRRRQNLARTLEARPSHLLALARAVLVVSLRSVPALHTRSLFPARRAVTPVVRPARYARSLPERIAGWKPGAEVGRPAATAAPCEAVTSGWAATRQAGPPASLALQAALQSAAG